jgi:hypothetical protein
MSFSIELTEKVRTKIPAWNLSNRLINEILEQLYEQLAETPTRHLVRIPAPADLLLFSFQVRAEGDPPMDYIFEFQVKYHSDEQTLVIYDCDFAATEAGPG